MSTITAASKQRFEIGTLVVVQGLQSDGGKKLNGKRGIVLREVNDDSNRFRIRYEVKIEGVTPYHKTSALKPDNLKPVAKLALPDKNYKDGKGHRPRGYVEDGEDHMARILCEFMVMVTAEYTPPETVFAGYAQRTGENIGNGGLAYFSANQMEWCGGICALANICKQKGKAGCEAVIFALLEGKQMYCDVLCLFLSGTPYIGIEGPDLDNAKQAFDDCMKQPTRYLTPDQHSREYTNIMQVGPLMLLDQIIKHCSTSLVLAFFEAGLKTSLVYHLVVQRMLRLICRNVMQTKDGIELAPYCKRILPYLCHGMMSRRVEQLLTGTVSSVTKKGDTIDDTIEEPEKEPLELSYNVANSLLGNSQEFASKEYMKTIFVKVFSQLTYGEIY